MTEVYYAYSKILDQRDLESYLNRLPIQLRAKFHRLQKEEDRSLFVLSYLLLTKILIDNGHSSDSLSSMQYDTYGRPFVHSSNFDFTISHTDGCAIVAFSEESRLGIDIEKKKDTDISDFKPFFPITVWDKITGSEHPLDTFYHYWTQLESALKADGRGLPVLDKSQIQISEDRIMIDQKVWYSHHLPFDNTISCAIASDKNIRNISLKEITAI